MKICEELLKELRRVLTDKERCEVELIRAYLDMLEGCIKASDEIFDKLDRIANAFAKLVGAEGGAVRYN